MGVDPWADENAAADPASASAGGGGDDDDARGDGDALEREARRRRELFFAEGFRDGIEEGKSATVQEGFDRGFREGAVAGLAYGRARGAVRSIAVFAGQVPGSSGWRDDARESDAFVREVPPAKAVAAARADFEAAVRAEAEPGKKKEGAFASRARAAREELSSAGFALPTDDYRLGDDGGGGGGGGAAAS
jgi:hypothetical protein|tara:strand:- start:37 stop:609 length:573 start_codon:yes stop_codon:yes gene_type:complete